MINPLLKSKLTNQLNTELGSSITKGTLSSGNLVVSELISIGEEVNLPLLIGAYYKSML